MSTLKAIDLKKNEVINIIQITDLHLFSKKSSKLYGYCTYDALCEVVNHIKKYYSSKEYIFFVTGDISQDESLESYQLALLQLEKLGAIFYWIHGNHDDHDKMKSIFYNSQQARNLKKLATKYWDFIFLNTCKRGTDHGYLKEDEIKFFLEELEKSNIENKKVAIIMHHHPCPVNTPLVDNYILQYNEKFINILNKNNIIKLMICGHVHNDYKISFFNKIVEACPATSFQWKKGTNKIETENIRGFKIFNMTQYSYTSSAIYI